MYVDYEYYVDNYGGTVVSESDFKVAMREAAAYIRSLTFVNGDIFADGKNAESVKHAVCVALEAACVAKREQEQGGNVKSESKDGLSVTFAISRRDGETVADYVNRCMFQAVRPVLLPTGWMGRKVGCAHDYERGCRDCL